MNAAILLTRNFALSENDKWLGITCAVQLNCTKKLKYRVEFSKNVNYSLVGFDFFDHLCLLYVINEQVMVAYSKDPSPVKLNLGIGVYRTEVNLVYCKLVSADKFVKVLNCVGVPFASIVV